MDHFSTLALPRVKDLLEAVKPFRNIKTARVKRFGHLIMMRRGA